MWIFPLPTTRVPSRLVARIDQVVGDSALLELANGCDSALLKLDLSACGFVTDAGILAMLVKCPRLTDLGLSGCGQVSDQACVQLDILDARQRALHVPPFFFRWAGSRVFGFR